MLRHLELPPTIKVQQVELLKKLPNWDKSQLEKVLNVLKEKGIVSISSNSLTKRIISLNNGVKIVLNSQEEKLLSELYGYISNNNQRR